MRDRRAGAVLVTEDGRRLFGIFTGRDAINRVLAEGKSAARTQLSAVMTRDPATIPPGKTAIDALRVMEDGRYRHLPIVHDGKVVGIVSRFDFTGTELDRFDEETGLGGPNLTADTRAVATQSVGERFLEDVVQNAGLSPRCWTLSAADPRRTPRPGVPHRRSIRSPRRPTNCGMATAHGAGDPRRRSGRPPRRRIGPPRPGDHRPAILGIFESANTAKKPLP